MGGSGVGIISGNEQYLSVHRIRCFEFTFSRGAPSPWRCPPFPPVKSALIGHSMSKGIKRRQPSLHRLLLAVAFNYFN